MSLKRWRNLKPGDVIQSRSGTERVVLAASGTGIQLKMLRESWRSPCPITTYVKCDRRNFKYTGRRVSRVPVVRCSLRVHRNVHGNISTTGGGHGA